jgi:acetyl-CoA C-acetyltransferase
MSAMLPEDRIPVIVGVGEIVDRPKEIAAGLEPLTLLEQALKRAEATPAQSWRTRLARRRQFLSWRYRDPENSWPRGSAPALASLLRPGRRREPDPISARSGTQDRARRVQRRAVCCGAEAQSTATKAQRAGIELPLDAIRA